MLASPLAHASCTPSGGVTSVSMASSGVLSAAVPAPQSAPATPAASVDVQSEARQALAAIGRLEDADTALSLAAEGAALY
ncbi:MAG TPA: hypothetical protein PK227_00250, partial [Thermomonas sp.]|nr:hypothetical protein [Thermomonas sp.]HPM55558.1 hypothetical protein [Thermomonas sp.]